MERIGTDTLHSLSYGHPAKKRHFLQRAEKLFRHTNRLQKVRKTSNLHPSAYIGTGTFASAACGGYSEQKGVAAVEIL